MSKLVFWFLGFIAFPAFAGQPSRIVIRETEIDGCHFKLGDSLNGTLSLTTDGVPPVAVYNVEPDYKIRHSVEISIRFYCDTAKGQQAFEDLHLKSEKDSWKLIPNANDPDNLTQAKLYALHGSGVSGALHTENDTTGEPVERTQGAVFCLTNQKQILCGASEVVGYVAYPRESRLPQVLNLLESIEFIDPAKSP